jgi:protein disulfide-isomerase
MLNKIFSGIGAFLIVSFVLIDVADAQTSKNGFVQSPNDGWLVNVEEAYSLSEKTNKPILANFTGSDWCGWCIRLKKEVFSQPEFKTWAADNVILLELDYPKKTKLPDAQARQNSELQQAFRVSGFPTIWMFDLNKPEGKSFEIQAYGKTGYAKGGASAYIKSLEGMIDIKKQSVN